MLVRNPRRVLLGGSIGTEDFPDLPIERIVWDRDNPGALRVDWEDGYTPTAADEARVIALAEATNDNDQILRERARAALVTNRSFLTNVAPQIISGAAAIVQTPTVNQANMQALARGVRQLAEQLDAITRQTTGLARMHLQDLDGTD